MTSHATKSSHWLRNAVGAMLVTVLLPTQAGAAPPSVPPQPADEGMTVLHLSESANRAISRDRLRALLRVEATAGNAKQVQAEINRRMTTALGKVKAVPGITPETGSYAVYEERQQNAPSRWRGSQTLSLLGRDFAELLAVVGDLQSDGLAISSLSFELAPETARAAQDALTGEALKRLGERAERVAAALHLSILRYRELRVGNVGGDHSMPFPVMAKVVAAPTAPPPVAEAGDATVQVTVDAEIVLGADDSKAP
jgi:predicted secreted protein